jgi:tetratricopeptide (TPR) repeat protein
VADAYLRLAHVFNVGGLFDEALSTVEKFLQEYAEQLITRPNGLHLRGELKLKFGRSVEAESDFQEALALARRIGTKFPELRAAVSLARLWQSQAKRDEARELLTTTYASFNDGFDTLDLKEAKALLDRIG